MPLSAWPMRFRAWGRRHSYSLLSSLGALLQHRVGTLLTVLVLGIAVLLPLGLWMTLENFDRLDLRRDEWGAVTVFLAAGTPEAEARQLAERIGSRDDTSGVTVISPEEGMAEFIESSGFGQSLDLLDDNPLPWVLTVSPAASGGGMPGASIEERFDSLMSYLASAPGVESVEFDHKWLQRLGQGLELGRAAVLVLSLLFGTGVIVVVANTIRLDVAARADEIEVLALVGAGKGFIRQPFLYSGFWYGVMGGALALVLLYLILYYLEIPLGRLLETYGREIDLYGPGAGQVAGLLLGSGLLGLLGALVSVQRYLRMLAVGGGLGRR